MAAQFVSSPPMPERPKGYENPAACLAQCVLLLRRTGSERAITLAAVLQPTIHLIEEMLQR